MLRILQAALIDIENDLVFVGRRESQFIRRNREQPVSQTHDSTELKHAIAYVARIHVHHEVFDLTEIFPSRILDLLVDQSAGAESVIHVCRVPIRI
jgi:hypothetical protein